MSHRERARRRTTTAGPDSHPARMRALESPDFDVRIDAVILDGSSAADRDGFERALRAEIATLLTSHVHPDVLTIPAAHERIATRPIAPHEGITGFELGVSVGRAVVEGLTHAPEAAIQGSRKGG